ncbi:50S ribosomal protein L11 methyltransferase [Klugiella xanthotipulae]|uniref:Methyltransferase family protein n=1 Tax=Klugiella xanthotipulae TaxID=244735 RepID=A0A543I541_9MICO|nr:methyltransferase domain-containing protein [Klugiella xanthotipulae]TQM65723.1 methyltransferase family protein [Klugiella xanthotipulae]
MTDESTAPLWDELAFLGGEEGQALLTELAAAPGDDAVALVSRLRKRGLTPEQVSAAVSQAALRRKATGKFGPESAELFFTEAGLEQATRHTVADRHAARFATAGLTHVADLGCGIGADALALARAGLTVTAVERDEHTARVAALNLSRYPRARVITADAESGQIAALLTGRNGDLDGTVDAVFLDPARRTSGRRNTRRLTDPNDYSPSLTFALDLAERLPVGIKLGPGLDRELIPDAVEAQWVSVGGQVVEMGLWSGPLARPGIRRSALVTAGTTTHELAAAADATDAEVRDLGTYLYEPDGAVIRARLIGALAGQLTAGMLSESIAYLTGDTLVTTPFAAAFRVREVLPVRERDLKRALRERRIGTLEIKKRGVDIDPAELRTRLALRGPESATLIVTRMGEKRVALLADRVSAGNPVFSEA